MGYDRPYSREEIHQMIYLSERRLRPTSPVSSAHLGHAITQHTEQRSDPFDRRHIAQDSTFASRKDMILAVDEALHDNVGQQELATLNAHNKFFCKIVFQLSVTRGKIRANVVQNPMARVGGQRVPAQGPQLYLKNVQVNSIFILIDKLMPPESWAPLHIQTAYPKDCVL